MNASPAAPASPTSGSYRSAKTANRNWTAELLAFAKEEEPYPSQIYDHVRSLIEVWEDKDPRSLWAAFQDEFGDWPNQGGKL